MPKTVKLHRGRLQRLYRKFNFTVWLAFLIFGLLSVSVIFVHSLQMCFEISGRDYWENSNLTALNHPRVPKIYWITVLNLKYHISNLCAGFVFRCNKTSNWILDRPSSNAASSAGTAMVRAFSLEILYGAWHFYVENPHAQSNICYFRQLYWWNSFHNLKVGCLFDLLRKIYSSHQFCFEFELYSRQIARFSSSRFSILDWPLLLFHKGSSIIRHQIACFWKCRISN